MPERRRRRSARCSGTGDWPGGSVTLALATEAEISARHLCFLETGTRSPQPRDGPAPRQRARHPAEWSANTLLLGAGYAPVYGERKLDCRRARARPSGAVVRPASAGAVPAIVVDGGWNIVMRNEAAGRIFGLSWGPWSSDPERRAMPCITSVTPRAASIHRQLGRVRRPPDPGDSPRGVPAVPTWPRAACAMSCSPTRACRPAGGSPTRGPRCRRCSPCGSRRTAWRWPSSRP